MRKIKCLIFIFLVFIFFNVDAAVEKCEQTELARVKELAKKVEFDYEYEIKDGVVEFSITAMNLDDDLKVIIVEDYYADKYLEFKYNDNHSYKIDHFSPGEKVVITINAYVPNACSGKTVLRKTIHLPYYNYFYSEEKCKGNEDFKYCNKLINNNISEKDFNNQLEKYIKSKEEKPVQEVIPKTNSWNMLIIIGGIVIILSIIVVITINIAKRRKKNSL